MGGKGPRRSVRREDYWRRMVTQQPGSGLSIRAWCQQQGVTEASFYAWRRTLAQRDAAEAAVRNLRRAGRPDATGSAYAPVAALQLVIADLWIEITWADDRRRVWACCGRGRMLSLPGTLQPFCADRSAVTTARPPVDTSWRRTCFGPTAVFATAARIA